MYTCADCAKQLCRGTGREGLPENCPMREKKFMQDCLAEYEKPENKEFYIKASELEILGYGRWTRLQETIQLCKMMGYKKVGVAFCGGLQKEGLTVVRLLRQHGLQVVSVMCKTGGTDKTEVGIPQELTGVEKGGYMPMCNPIAQAKLLNQEKCEFNILVGLCVGHDSMFYKYCEGLVTTLVVKDRVLCHNPVGAIYQADGYYKAKLENIE